MSESIKLNNNKTDENEDIDTSKNKSDFVSLTSRLISNINFKMAIFLFFLGMIIFSDLFIDGFISKIDGTVNGECCTTKGSILQLIIFILGYLILDLLIKGEWI